MLTLRQFTNNALGAIILSSLIGCSTQPQINEPCKPVEVPVTVPCVTTLPEMPKWEYEATDSGAPLTKRVKALVIEREQRKAYESQLLSTLDACK